MDNKEIKLLCDEWKKTDCEHDCEDCNFGDFCYLMYNFTCKLNHEMYEVKEEISHDEKQVNEFCFKLQTILSTLGYKDVTVNFTRDSIDWKGWVRIYILSDSYKTQVYNYTKLSLLDNDTNYELLYLAKQFLERKVLNG